MIGLPISRVNAPGKKSPEDAAAEIMGALRATGAWDGEVRNIKKDGTPFWCHAHVSTFEHSQHGTVWVSVHEDITARKEAEEKLRKTMEDLEYFNRAAVGREMRRGAEVSAQPRKNGERRLNPAFRPRP